MIGVFDSGYGGLSVLRQIRSLMPEYDYLYLGDNARAPYGPRSFDVVYRYTLEAVEALFARGCEIVILACNTASAKALRTIQQNDLPSLAPNKRVLGVIRPTVELMGELSATGHIGVLGTPGTVNSRSYEMEIEKLFPNFRTYTQACPMWVPLVENKEYDQDGADYFVKKYIDQLFCKCADIDTIILGCTHYPLLLEKIQKYVPQGVRVVSQGTVVADSLKDYLRRHPEMEVRLSRGAKTNFLTTENPDKFTEMASVFLNAPIQSHRITL